MPSRHNLNQVLITPLIMTIRNQVSFLYPKEYKPILKEEYFLGVLR